MLGLLLSWYLQNKPALVSVLDSHAAINQSIQEVISEMEELRATTHGQLPAVPLVVASELLADGSIWQCKFCTSFFSLSSSTAAHGRSFRAICCVE